MSSMHDGRPDAPGVATSAATSASVPAAVSADADHADPSPAGSASAPVDLDRLRARPLAEHADVFEQLHKDLQAALADIDHA